MIDIGAVLILRNPFSECATVVDGALIKMIDCPHEVCRSSEDLRRRMYRTIEDGIAVGLFLFFVTPFIGKFFDFLVEKSLRLKPQLSRCARWSARCAGCAPSAGVEARRDSRTEPQSAPQNATSITAETKGNGSSGNTGVTGRERGGRLNDGL